MVGLHRSGPDLFERRRSNGPSGPYTTLRGEEIIYSRAVERKDYCGMASEPDLPKIADGGVERAATISTKLQPKVDHGLSHNKHIKACEQIMNETINS